MITRRFLLADLGKGTIGIAVLGLAACGSPTNPTITVASSSSTVPTNSSTVPTNSSTVPASEPTGSTTAPATTPANGASSWHRVNLGFVSAYLIARSGEVAVIDTGVGGSGTEIEAGLVTAGLDWGAVGHVILTHNHQDHQGSLGEVMEAAPAATAYAGAEDIPGIRSPRPLAALADGDQVFDLTVVSSPGHTAGHICLLDPALGLLVAGDALNGEGGNVAGPNPRFSDDMETAIASVAKLGAFVYDTVVFGHGEPVAGGASTKVAELATQL